MWAWRRLLQLASPAGAGLAEQQDSGSAATRLSSNMCCVGPADRADTSGPVSCVQACVSEQAPSGCGHGSLPAQTGCCMVPLTACKLMALCSAVGVQAQGCQELATSQGCSHPQDHHRHAGRAAQVSLLTQILHHGRPCGLGVPCSSLHCCIIPIWPAQSAFPCLLHQDTAV